LNEDQIRNQREEKFASLLYEISQVPGYDFGRTHIRDNVYRPQLHSNIDEMELETRTRIRDLLRTDALPVRFVQEQASATLVANPATDCEQRAPTLGQGQPDDAPPSRSLHS
jgi:hypothetical protein